ncbi:hypothetical protein C8R43DRAFT_1229270 [Mycena crocata]|nr:hypothetical protein C8R43DRAFT_1229270 [Mycena crocata]
MQCKILAALLVSFVTLTVSAAPVPGKNLHILVREIEYAPFVGMTEVAREVTPEVAIDVDAATIPEAEPAEPRGCRMYQCF